MAEPRPILHWMARKKKPWREAMWGRAAQADAGLPTADAFHGLFRADVDVITEAAEDATSTAEVRKIVGGWCSLIADLGTDHCWDDAHRETGWFMTESVFHDLRSWAVLVDPDVTASTFGALLRHIEDEEDVGEAGCITETLLGIAEEHDVGQGDFLDPWGVATQR